MKLQLFIDGKEAVLPAGFSLKMVRTSPLFSDNGDFSYQFELDVEPNRHIFGPVASPMGFVRMREFHALPAEIWYDGNQVFVGQTEVTGEQTFSERGKVSFNILSNNGAFKDMISGMNCRDVKPKEKIVVGMRPMGYIHSERTGFRFPMMNTGAGAPHVTIPFMFSSCVIPNTHLMVRPFVNVSRPYPFPYCNVRACAKRSAPEGASSSSDSTSDTQTGHGYSIMYADRPGSAPCFYVLYFLDSLFKQLDIIPDNSDIVKFDDMTRLAMLNVMLGYKEDNTLDVSKMDVANDIPSLASSHIEIIQTEELTLEYNGSVEMKYLHQKEVQNLTFDEHKADFVCCVATQKNFPDVNVEDVMDSLKYGFGVYLDYDQQSKYGKLFFAKDVMRDTEVMEPDCILLEKPATTRSIDNGYCVTYGQMDNDYYNYEMSVNRPSGPEGYNPDDDPDGSIWDAWNERYWEEHFFDDTVRSRVQEKHYAELVDKTLSAFDTDTYYDRVTGSTFRVKVNENTGKQPQLFEVGAYHDYRFGVVDEKGEPETYTLKFTPVTINDVWGFVVNQDNTENDAWIKPNASDKQQLLAVWVDAELPYDGSKTVNISNEEETEWQDLMMEGTNVVLQRYKRKSTLQARIIAPDAYDFTTDEKCPLEDANIGLQLGIMRGAGNDSGEEIVRDYDDEGNDTWITVAGNYNFTADCVDPYGRVFDYNGSLEDGVSFDGRLSLKLDARKVKEYDKDGYPVYYDMANQDYARRGLVPQLLEDLLYFKAHHVRVTLPVVMSLSAVRNLRLLKWNRFGDYIGLIKQVNYELTENGLRNVSVELLVPNK